MNSTLASPVNLPKLIITPLTTLPTKDSPSYFPQISITPPSPDGNPHIITTGSPNGTVFIAVGASTAFIFLMICIWWGVTSFISHKKAKRDLEFNRNFDHLHYYDNATYGSSSRSSMKDDESMFFLNDSNSSGSNLCLPSEKDAANFDDAGSEGNGSSGKDGRGEEDSDVVDPIRYGHNYDHTRKKSRFSLFMTRGLGSQAEGSLRKVEEGDDSMSTLDFTRQRRQSRVNVIQDPINNPRRSFFISPTFEVIQQQRAVNFERNSRLFHFPQLSDTSLGHHNSFGSHSSGGSPSVQPLEKVASPGRKQKRRENVGYYHAKTKSRLGMVERDRPDNEVLYPPSSDSSEKKFGSIPKVITPSKYLDSMLSGE